MKKTPFFYSTKHMIFLVLIMGLLLKLPYINNPISDWHSWNQTSTMANARYIAQDGLDALLHPKVDVLESLDKSSNATFAEFPLLAAVLGGGFAILGEESEWLARLIVILFSLLGTVYFYLLVSEETNPEVALIAVAMYLVSPMVWFFHRTIITDVPMASFVIAGLYHFRHWLRDEAPKQLLYCTIFTALAALAKAYALYIGIAYLLLIIDQWGWKKLFRPAHIFLAIGSWAPLLGWIYFCWLQIDQGATGANLTGSSELLGPVSIWWNPRYWSRIVSSLGDFTLMPTGLIAFIAAFCFFKKLKEVRIVLYWFASVCFYYLFVRQGNMEHDYYQIPFSAPALFIAALGWFYWGSNWKKKWSPKRFQWTVGVVIVLTILIGGKYSYTKATLDRSPVMLGKQLASLNPTKELVLVVNSDGLQRNQSIFYSKAKGWHIRHLPTPGEIAQYRASGARWFGINIHTDELEGAKNRFDQYERDYKLVWTGKSTDRYLKSKTLKIYHLTK